MHKFEDKIRKILIKETGLDDVSLGRPPGEGMGDYAFACFPLAGIRKKNPSEIAKDLQTQIQDKRLPDPYISEVRSEGPYLNFFVNRKKFARQVLTASHKPKKKKERIMIEYSGPNPFKGFHIGHLRNTVLGIALVNLLRYNGYRVVPVNYYNDTGAHVSKCIWGIISLYQNQVPEKDRGEWLGRVYAEASRKISDTGDESYREIQQKIEKGDRELNKLRKQGIRWSEQHFKSIYAELDADFEHIFYDSELITEGKKVVDELLKKGIAEKSDGAVIINLEKYKLPTVVILRSDGTAVYITKDFALAKKKFSRFKIDRSIYVVGSEQINHFRQLFKILELYGFDQAKKCYHLAYELVMLESSRKMSSRAGSVILYSDIRSQLKDKISKEVSKRHKSWSKKRIKASEKAIFSSAIRFDMLKQEPRKVINYNLEKALDFEGETGPYVQYAHARICSILKKHGRKIDLDIDYSVFGDSEMKLIRMLSDFHNTAGEAAEKYRVHLLCHYLLNLAQAFNEFYHTCPILAEEEKVMKARLVLADKVKQVLAQGLNLLGIEAPEEM